MLAKRKINEYYMSRALSLARRGTGRVRPNPRVGCVLVCDGRIIGEGYHARCGEEHAEVAALNNAAQKGESVRGATAYVNLEPCSHFGRTPPCAPRLVQEGIASVVVGMVDPNPKVNRSGIEILKAAGIEVSLSCLEWESKWLNRGFIRAKTLKRPWVTLKAATGIDGKMALANGESKWITGDTARSWAHLMRASHDAVLIGVGTVLSDDPELTVRHTQGDSPLRVVLDAELATPPTARVLKGGCLVLTCSPNPGRRKALEEAGAEVCTVPGASGRIDLASALDVLASRNVQMLMVEGGPRVLSSFVDARLCDALSLFVAPCIMGQGATMGDGLLLESVSQAFRLKNVRVRRAGGDLLAEGLFECSPDL